MTISDAIPNNWMIGTPHGELSMPPLWLSPESAIDFTIGPESTPVEAMKQAAAMVGMTLPTCLSEVPDPEAVCETVKAVLTELVDVTARHRASLDLVGKVKFDGAHVTVSVGDMNCLLPAPSEEPGLYLVHRHADEVGQYAGDLGGRVTWAAIRVLQ
ncbi:hypothetical protein ACGFYQ_33730 [Streptomyces sp. NPDC048258]|uniref:hypothetical protein n=1 Tax=Streptomyces sp. NPDC048258 TaxID=3365527 RepID=UPI00372257C1